MARGRLARLGIVLCALFAAARAGLSQPPASDPTGSAPAVVEQAAPGPAAGAASSEAATPGAAVREELLPIRGTELFVARLGRGEPVIVIHGGPVLEHGYLLPHLAPLTDAFELVFYDQRLSGRSTGTVDPASVRIASFVDDIEALRTALGLGRVHLVGHSWGGLLAMRYAIRYGEHLRSLVLLDSLAPTAELWRQEQQSQAAALTEEDRRRRQEIQASEAFRERRPEAVRELLMQSFASEFADRTKLDRLHLYVPDDYDARSRQFGAMMVDLESFDLRSELERVDVPTLIVYGSEEAGAEIAGPAIHRHLPHSELLRVPDAGHFPFIEHPETVLPALRRFLERSGAPDPAS